METLDGVKGKDVVIARETGELGRGVTPWLSQASATVAVVDRALSQDSSQVQNRFVADRTSETAMAHVFVDIDKVLGRFDD